MITDSNTQLLYSLISNSDFNNFLQLTKSSLTEFEGLLKDTIGSNSKLRPFSSSFVDEAKQLMISLTSYTSSKPQTCQNLFTINKAKNKSIITSEDCSESGNTLPRTTYSSSDKEQAMIFDVVKNERPRTLRISLRTDCIRKKVKSMFHKFVITKLNCLLYPTVKSASFKPLPKVLSINLNLRESKRWSEMSLRELMICDDIPQSGFDKLNKHHNANVLKEDLPEALNTYLNTKWKIVFEEFLLSSELSKSISAMEKINPTYALRFRKHSFSFLKFIEH